METTCEMPEMSVPRIAITRYQKILLMEEILHQLMWRIYHYLQGFTSINRISSINSITSIQYYVLNWDGSGHDEDGHVWSKLSPTR